MSRIAKKPLVIPAAVTVTIFGNVVTVKGPRATLTRTVHPHVRLALDGSALAVTVAQPDEKGDRSLWGLTWRLLENMIMGVEKDFTKRLELVGVGYKAVVSGQKLTLSLGYSHPIVITLPEGITATVEKNVNLTIAGANNETVGNIAAHIRALRKPEPYKGKGVKYADEVIRRKAGKAAKTAGAA